jgi:hypothetical protein
MSHQMYGQSRGVLFNFSRVEYALPLLDKFYFLHNIHIQRPVFSSTVVQYFVCLFIQRIILISFFADMPQRQNSIVVNEGHPRTNPVSSLTVFLTSNIKNQPLFSYLSSHYGGYSVLSMLFCSTKR